MIGCSRQRGRTHQDRGVKRQLDVSLGKIWPGDENLEIIPKNGQWLQSSRGNIHAQNICVDA